MLNLYMQSISINLILSLSKDILIDLQFQPIWFQFQQKITLLDAMFQCENSEPKKQNFNSLSGLLEAFRSIQDIDFLAETTQLSLSFRMMCSYFVQLSKIFKVVDFDLYHAISLYHKSPFRKRWHVKFRIRDEGFNCVVSSSLCASVWWQ